MKDDIYLLGDAFEQEITTCKQEEDSVRKMEATLKSNNMKRIKIINEIRLNKIKEIDAEYEKSQLELKELKGKIDSILHAYCEKNGHRDILVSSRILGSTGAHSFTYGTELILTKSYKCAICGRTRNCTGKGYSSYTKNKYERIIPDDLYDDETLTTDGKSFRILQEEISKLTQYINYLYSLKLKLCELFGHDAGMIDDFENFTCKCCGKTIRYQEYIETYHRAKYRGIVNFYYDTYPEMDYIISSTEELDLSLPTFESYQKSLELEPEKVQEQKDKPKKLTKKLEPWGTTPSTNLDL